MLKHDAQAFSDNVELIARYFFHCYNLNEWAEWQEQLQVHLIFVGFSTLVPALIRQAILLSPYKNFKPLAITLLSPQANLHQQQLLEHFPILAQRAPPEAVVIDRLQAVECTPDYQVTSEQLLAMSHDALPSGVIFADAQASLNRQRALVLRKLSQQAHVWRIPFYVYTSTNAPVSNITAYYKQPQEQIITFGNSIEPAVLAELESNAAYIHESYRQHQLRHNPAQLSAISSLPWQELPETYRLANRRAGDHLPIKLASMGCYVQPGKRLVLDSSIKLNASNSYMPFLARLEHRSWRYERLLNGWRYGAIRDEQQRLHPSLVLWHDPRLSTAEKAKDLEQIDYVRLTLQQQAGQEPITVRYHTAIGLIGHNFLTPEQAQRVLQSLQTVILPALSQQYPQHFFTLFTPLAPGSDYLLAKAMTDWLSTQAIAHRIIPIQTIGLPTVVAAYQSAWQQDGSWDGSEHTLKAKMPWSQAQDLILQGLRSFIQQTPSCTTIVDLRPEGQAEFAQHTLAFQHAARWLVRHCQHLIAVYDPKRSGGAGGTAETLQWWREKDPSATHLQLIQP